MDAACRADGCDRQAKARGLCMRCWKRWDYAGRPDTPPPVPPRYPKPVCSVEGCGKELSGSNSGMCRYHWLRRNGSAVEEFIYRGITFRRYPDANQPSHQRYFKPGGADAARGVEALHREIYKDNFGPIPDGWHVHHADGDWNNNDPSNLKAIPQEEHWSEHHTVGFWNDREAVREHLDRIRPMASEWHRSKEGRRWHSEHAKRQSTGIQPDNE